jgi:proline dehydrogenase
MRGLVVKAVLVVTRWRWVRWVFTRTRIGRRVSLRFVAGETLDSAIAASLEANRRGMPVSLNLLGEHVTDAASARQSFLAYRDAIDALRVRRIDGNLSVKLTQLGLEIDEASCAGLLDELAERAVEAGITITIDMEDSPFTDITLDIYEEVQLARGNLGVALQAYLHRTPADLGRISPLGGHVRLCKGAYDEPVEIAYRSGDEVNDAFDRLLGELMREGGPYPAIASHDEDRVERAISLAADRTEGYEIQMLYGVRLPLQEELVERGLRMRVYIPYGEAWYPYLTRRMAERPANFWFFVRALFGRR